MNELSLSARVAVAQNLLQSVPTEEYAALPAEQRANVEEAIEFLERVTGWFPERGVYE
jgi:hypothetical protein